MVSYLEDCRACVQGVFLFHFDPDRGCRFPEVKDFQIGPSSEVENICPIQTGGFLTDCYLTSVHVIEPNLRFELANI